MISEKPKPETRLIFQGSVPVEDIVEAEELYKQLKEMLKNYSDNVTFNGQIMKMLEPCCPPPAKPNPQKGVVDPESRDYR